MSHKNKIHRIPSDMGYPFSTAVRVGDRLELSGQIGLNSSTGKLVPGGVGPETTQTLKNIEAVLNANGSSMRDVIKVSVFLKDIAEFSEMNTAYGKFFDKQDYPARSAVAVAGLALGARVEIECSALLSEN